MENSNLYTGWYSSEGRFTVYKNDEVLDPGRSQRTRNHSPDGFAWGYGGSGPAQLALAILLEETDRKTAVERYQDFKWKVIANLPHDFVDGGSPDQAQWTLRSEEIRNFLKSG